MEIYITNLETGDRLRLPMLPEEISGTISNKFITYNTIKNGDVKIPAGPSLDTYTWKARFPGKKRKKDPYIREWTGPKACDKFMTALKAKNGKPVKARLLVTETSINLDVYMQTYTPVETGGYGDIEYSVTFVRAKKIEVSTTEKASSSKGSSSSSKKKNSSKDSKKSKELKKKPAANSDDRTSPPKAKTYTVKSGDCLWAIAQKFYGNGAQYTKIYNANKGTVGSNPNVIYPGQVLKIP